MTLNVRRMPDGKEIAEVASVESALAVSRLQGDVWLYAETLQDVPMYDPRWVPNLPRFILHDGGAIDISNVTHPMKSLPMARRANDGVG